MSAGYPVFVKRDLDGFFGLAIDNLVQLLLIVSLCTTVCGMTGDNARFIYEYIMPGAAVSLLIGNLFYAAQAHWVARRERRSDVTALPYGINTPSLLVYVFFVMKPAFDRTGSAEYAWKLGLIACLGSGLIEFAGAFVAERLRRNTPRAALLSTLAGIAITFIAMKFALEIWDRPLVAMVPMAVVLLVYFSQVRFPLGLPGGFVAVLLGTALAWVLGSLGVSTGVPVSTEAVREACAYSGRHWPQWVGPVLWDTIRSDTAQVISLLSVIIPMGLFNVIGSLQNIESAEAGGDVFATGPSLAVNGIGTIAAACFGSCFPTTIYIGHPGWKALGARAGYSTLNGLVMTILCVTGTVAVVSKIVPMEAGIAIVLWIGIVITAQAFQATPVRHAPAVALGLFPAIAAWGAMIVSGAFTQTGLNTVNAATTAPAAVITSLPVTESLPAPATQLSQWPGVATIQSILSSEDGSKMETSGFLVHGMNIMERGYIFTCMIIAAISAFLIDRRFFHAAGWSLAAAVLTILGLMHAYQMVGNTADYWLIGTTPAEGAFTYHAYPVVIGYLLMAAVFVIMGYRHRHEAVGTAKTLEDARVVTPGSLSGECFI
ncbi:MAG TPA: NCS2 family permease [Phycisphaerae bacterium]|nr:NCS2 family permease [Phycisphaerae bacterium]HRR85448.1 NCS2 family permease [Phycisphaerae bacterium]